MARNTSTVYLGFEDELVTDKNKHHIDYTTNKVGGQPSWPAAEISITSCPICGLRRPLLLQIYAPLEHSPFHRTLYLFACVNAVCSNQSRGWLCIRVQHLDRHSPAASSVEERRAAPPAPNINWCSGADDWGDGGGAVGGIELGETVVGRSSAAGGGEDDNCNEPNGNMVVMSTNDNRNMSDDDDETNSLENDMLPSVFGQLQLVHSLDDNDRNANGARKLLAAQAADQYVAVAGGGAVGRLQTPNATAEIEGEESADALVTIDAPMMPKRDLIALLKQTTAVPTDPGKLMLRAYFVSVEEERSGGGGAGGGGAMGEHIRELLHEYQSKDEKLNTSPSSPVAGAVGGDTEEKYEKGIPAHGDLMFHNFVTTLHENPGQILRYTRDALPLLVAPLPDMRLPPCENCGGQMMCEMQLLPTLIPTLRFASNGDAAPLEFGNVLVFTCVKSCWDTPDRWRGEQIVVQPEI